MAVSIPAIVFSEQARLSGPLWPILGSKRDIVFLLGVGISKRRNKNWAGGSGGCGINKRMEVQMDQLSSPL